MKLVGIDDLQQENLNSDVKRARESKARSCVQEIGEDDDSATLADELRAILDRGGRPVLQAGLTRSVS